MEPHHEDIGDWYVSKPDRLKPDVLGPEDATNFENMNNTYTNGDASLFKVRDRGYVEGWNKEKSPSDASAYDCVGINVFRCRSNLEHIASKVDSLRQYIDQHRSNKESKEPDFLLFTWLFQSMWTREYTAVVHLFRKSSMWSLSGNPNEYDGFQRTFSKFLDMSDKDKS